MRVGVGADTEDAEQHKNGGDDQRQKAGVSGNTAGTFPIALPQTLGQQGVCPDTGADAHRHHQHLQRKGESECIQRSLTVFFHVGHKGAVHDVIHSLQHHGEHHGNAHGQHQPFDRHDLHFVRLFYLFHCLSPLFFLTK